MFATRVMGVSPFTELARRHEARVPLEDQGGQWLRMIPAYCIDTAPPGEKAAFATLSGTRETQTTGPCCTHWASLRKARSPS